MHLVCVRISTVCTSILIYSLLYCFSLFSFSDRALYLTFGIPQQHLGLHHKPNLYTSQNFVSHQGDYIHTITSSDNACANLPRAFNSFGRLPITFLVRQSKILETFSEIKCLDCSFITRGPCCQQLRFRLHFPVKPRPTNDVKKF